MAHRPNKPTRPKGKTSKLPWKAADPVNLCGKGRPQFSGIPAEPGVYLLEIGNRAYIGSTENLKRRIGEYRNATNNIGEHWRRHLIQQNGGVRVFYITNEDMHYRGERLSLEQTAIKEALTAGVILENKGATRGVEYHSFAVAFLKNELKRAQAALRKAEKAVIAGEVEVMLYSG